VVHSVKDMSTKDMSTDQRLAIEDLLGRRLRDDEKLSIRPISITKYPPPLTRRIEISEAMRQYFHRIDEQRKDAPEEEINSGTRPPDKPIR
jgi:hypothetical protein